MSDVPIMGFYQTPQQSGGRIVVFGDSNCLDSAHLHRGNATLGCVCVRAYLHMIVCTRVDCFWLLDSLLKYATTADAPPPFTASEKIRPPPSNHPKHMAGEHEVAMCVHVIGCVIMCSSCAVLQAIDFIIIPEYLIPLTPPTSSPSLHVPASNGRCHTHSTRLL